MTRFAFPAAFGFGIIAAGGGLAAPPPISVPVTGDQSDSGQAGSLSLSDQLKRSNALLGNLFGIRTELSKIGVTLAIQETSEVLGNATGGVKTGAAYDGLTQVVLQLDTQRAFNWHGGLFNISALQIHGRNLSEENLLSLQTASGIEAEPATRLWELWYDQKLLPEDRLDIKIGQQSLDQEFISNTNGVYFVNTMFGWPMLPSADLPGGGAAYPLSALGVRFRYRPVNSISLLGGVFNGNPAPNNNGDAQVENPSGTSFPLNGGVMAIAEVQYAYPAVGSMVYPGGGAPLGRTYRLGAWYNSETFDDQNIDNSGLSLADPATSGIPRQHSGNWSIYGAADQMVWRKPDNPNRSVSVFGRAMYTPLGDRNLIDFSFNGGVVFHYPLAGRPDDTVALGMGYTHVGSGAADYDREVALIAATTDRHGFYPVRTSETFVELTYQYQVFPWWQLQPDLQYVFNPGGGVQNPNDPARRVGDELVLGLRTNVAF